MSVIVHANENIDSALKRLHREVMREKILETYREKAYRVKPSTEEFKREGNGLKWREEEEQLQEGKSNLLTIGKCLS